MCNIGIEKLSDAFKSEKNIIRAIDLLTGEAFCTVRISFVTKDSDDDKIKISCKIYFQNKC